jgi:uncharacterized protein YndB with AHSA1/START domain
VYATRASVHMVASPADVYRALLDPDAIARWRVPDGMTAHVHDFDAREGGAFRISLSYDSPTDAGKSQATSDTYHGRFVRLVPDRVVVEAFEFETDDPALAGEMTMTTSLTPSGGGTEVEIVHDGVPDAVPPGDNEAGTRMALANLEQFVAGRQSRAED